MTNVMASTAEAAIGASFINAQDTVPEHTTLIEMGHPQPPTRIQVNNNTANAFDKKTSSRSGPRPSTYSSTGYRIDAPSGNSILFGYQEQPILVIITPSTIPLLTTNSCATNTFTQKTK